MYAHITRRGNDVQALPETLTVHPWIRIDGTFFRPLTNIEIESKLGRPVPRQIRKIYRCFICAGRNGRYCKVGAVGFSVESNTESNAVCGSIFSLPVTCAAPIESSQGHGKLERVERLDILYYSTLFLLNSWVK